ncbi:MAG TPA: 2-oxoacid:acceptor oxidoreductase family protein [Planctomycetota bacterium]|nr:2-oxoacid:acceptor oxidoreductase family protein [Planctomycetota bacterium]HRR81327.1 2-oxoacid:acceptor oxidoreductase family protein [Planctomycetota bacterium]HRT95591.1 2-oxoacid:acceptor oxidoreductase family protein [Planctomycetota bacterium]
MAKDLTEIRWHGRGGQGAKTAATMVAEVALEEGKYSQGFPEYGPERMGAPIRGYTRIASEPIRLHCPITAPDVVVILDATLIGADDLADGLKPDGAIIVNTPEPPAAIRKRLGVSHGKVYTVDATKIAIETIGRPIPNTPMIGALLRVSGFMKLETVFHDIEKKFLKKLGAAVVQGNITAVQRAYQEVQGE